MTLGSPKGFGSLTRRKIREKHAHTNMVLVTTPLEKTLIPKNMRRENYYIGIASADICLQ